MEEGAAEKVLLITGIVEDEERLFQPIKEESNLKVLSQAIDQRATFQEFKAIFENIRSKFVLFPKKYNFENNNVINYLKGEELIMKIAFH